MWATWATDRQKRNVSLHACKNTHLDTHYSLSHDGQYLQLCHDSNSTQLTQQRYTGPARHNNQGAEYWDSTFRRCWQNHFFEKFCEPITWCWCLRMRVRCSMGHGTTPSKTTVAIEMMDWFTRLWNDLDKNVMCDGAKWHLEFQNSKECKYSWTTGNKNVNCEIFSCVIIRFWFIWQWCAAWCNVKNY